MSIKVREANIHDAEMIAELSRQTFYQSFASQNTKENIDKFMNDSFAKETLMMEVGTPGNVFLLAFDGEEQVGYVLMRENNNPPELQNLNAMEIARIYVVQNYIGKGVGKILMQRCIELAMERKFSIVWLGVWQQNLPAISFYTKWGFEKFGTHIFILGDDPQIDWLMKKPLFPSIS